MKKIIDSEIPNIIFLGPAGSYTEIAAENLLKEFFKNRNKNIDFSNDFNESVSHKKEPKSTILQVIESVDNSCGKTGIVPIENSIEGIVRETVDNLVKTTSRVLITGEIIIPIAHCLISKSNNISGITKIISKPEALAQCQYFIANNLKHDVEKLSATSTSEAVRQLNELPEDYAAIGTSKAAEIYGLKIIAKNINDEKDNLTRFVSLGANIPTQTGNDKTSMAFSVHNKPGMLVDILSVFKSSNINLSYIESRPSKKVFGDYTFFIDFDGHIENPDVQKVIGKITPFVSFYRLLGSYPKGNTVDFS